jgi:hypothetical protein
MGGGGMMGGNTAPVEVGDLGFNDDEVDTVAQVKKQEEEAEAAETEAALLSSLQSNESLPSNDIPEDPVFASFKEYVKCAEFSVRDMQTLRVVPLRPVR